METTTVPKLLPHLWKSTLVSGILALGLGVAALVWPGITILAAAILFGVYLLITGVTQVFFAFAMHISATGRVLLFLSGAAALILAVLAFRHFGDDPLLVILLLAIWIAVGFIFRGVATTVAAISDPQLPGRGWALFTGILSLLAGIVVLASPFTSIWILTLVVGIWLIVIGIVEIITAFDIRRRISHLRYGSATSVTGGDGAA